MAGEDLAATERKMVQAIEALERDLRKVRTGAASASLVEAVSVAHGGRRARLIDMASVTVPDPRQIVIVPWDPASLRAVGTAISQSRIGLTPTLDGGAIRIYVPALSEERRRELATIVGRRVEQARVEIRAIRHEAQNRLTARLKAASIGAGDAQRERRELQRMTDRYVDEADRRGQAKEASLLHLEPPPG